MAKDIPHGTWSCYSNRKCRCDLCMEAMRAYHRDRYANNPEKYRPFSDAWKAANPERVKASGRASAKRRYAVNPGMRIRLKADAAAWAIANRERSREIKAAYKHRNPAMVREHVERRRARRAAVACYAITETDWLRLCARHDNRCAYCRKAKKLSMDHVVPIARGGQHSIGNLLPACGTCNSSKGSKLLVEWRRRS